MLSEADTCRQYVAPKLYAPGWTDDQKCEAKLQPVVWLRLDAETRKFWEAEELVSEGTFKPFPRPPQLQTRKKCQDAWT
jgi:hypothetical protein